jgi:hypothetical protein
MFIDVPKNYRQLSGELLAEYDLCTACANTANHHWDWDANVCIDDTGCATGEEKVNGACVPKCPLEQTRNNAGECVKPFNQLGNQLPPWAIIVGIVVIVLLMSGKEKGKSEIIK